MRVGARSFWASCVRRLRRRTEREVAGYVFYAFEGEKSGTAENDETFRVLPYAAEGTTHTVTVLYIDAHSGDKLLPDTLIQAPHYSVFCEHMESCLLRTVDGCTLLRWAVPRAMSTSDLL